MAGKQNIISKKTKNEQYLDEVFELIRKRDRIELSVKKTYFNNTELRLIGEIVAAKKEGRRLISTQIASLLGVTRSAISQIVNRLEDAGIVKRVADDVDRKIAYIEFTDKMVDAYKADYHGCVEFVGRVVDAFGEEKFNQMCGMFHEFLDIFEQEKNNCEKSHK